MARYLLDTTVLIDYLRGRQPVLDAIKSMARDGHQLRVCCINVAELHSRIRPSEEVPATALLDSLEYLPISISAAKRAGDWRYEMARHGVTVATANALVAACAYENGSIVVTGNVDDFQMEGLQVLKQP